MEHLDSETYLTLRREWAEAPRAAEDGLRSIISKQVRPLRAGGGLLCRLTREYVIHWIKSLTRNYRLCKSYTLTVCKRVNPLPLAPHLIPLSHVFPTLSSQGVTMIATLDARRLALEIAGRWRDEDAWGEAVREVRVWEREDEYGLKFGLRSGSYPPDFSNLLFHTFRFVPRCQRQYKLSASTPSRTSGARRRTATRALRAAEAGGARW